MNEIYTYVYRQGSQICLRTRNEDGNSINELISDFQPIVYIPDSMGDHTDHRKEVTLEPRVLSDDLGEASNELRNMGRDVYGTKNFHWQYIQRAFHDHKEFPRLKELIHRAIIDIEVYSPDGFPDPQKALKEINAITLYSSKDDHYHVFHLYDYDWKSKSKIEEYELGALKKTTSYAFETEKELLESFIEVWSTDYPDIVSGWNADTFDFPYLFNRLIRVFNNKMAMELSPFGKVKRKTVKGRFSEEQQIDIVGVEIRDYLNLYLKYTFKKRESYKLDYIAYVELDEKKVEYDQEGLHSLADEDPNKFIDYNWKDVWLVKKLDDKLGLMNLIIDLAYMTGINFEETDSPIKLWDNMINNYLDDRDMHLPIHGLGNPKRSFEGAYVYDDVKMGLQRWIVSFDLTSLYPSIIRQWNMGPDTIEYSALEEQNIIEEIISGKVSIDDGYCIAGNGTVYRTDETSFLNALMTEGFNERKAAKDKMIEAKKNDDDEQARLMHTRQLALKVFLNSAYGAFGNEYFRVFDVRIAEAITLSGQLASKWLFGDLNDYLNKIIGGKPKDRILSGDTDSVYLSLEDLVNKFMPNQTDENKIVNFLDKVADKMVEDCIEPSYQRLQKATNCREQLMNMDREIIGSDAFWRAKKNYAIRILDDEGKRLDDPKYKIMGLEPARSTYRESDREKMEDSIKIILNMYRGYDNDDLIKLVEDYEKEYVTRPLSEIGYAQRVNHIKKYIDGKGVASRTPANSKAAINYNNMILNHGLENKFPLVEEGDNIFILALKTPNPTPFPVIAHKGVIPKEFGLDKYIDYATMFERNFFGPVQSYAEAVGWKAENTADLEDFFA